MPPSSGLPPTTRDDDGGPVQPERGLHVAIIMDGNGRWAKARGLPRTIGHRYGVNALRRTVEAAGWEVATDGLEIAL